MTAPFLRRQALMGGLCDTVLRRHEFWLGSRLPMFSLLDGPVLSGRKGICWNRKGGRPRDRRVRLGNVIVTTAVGRDFLPDGGEGASLRWVFVDHDAAHSTGVVGLQCFSPS